jgi:hypothetical protein
MQSVNYLVSSLIIKLAVLSNSYSVSHLVLGYGDSWIASCLVTQFVCQLLIKLNIQPAYCQSFNQLVTIGSHN